MPPLIIAAMLLLKNGRCSSWNVPSVCCNSSKGLRTQGSMKSAWAVAHRLPINCSGAKPWVWNQGPQKVLVFGITQVIPALCKSLPLTAANFLLIKYVCMVGHPSWCLQIFKSQLWNTSLMMTVSLLTFINKHLVQITWKNQT